MHTVPPNHGLLGRYSPGKRSLCTSKSIISNKLAVGVMMVMALLRMAFVWRIHASISKLEQ